MLKLFTPLLAALAGDELKRTTARAKRTAIFGAVIGVFGIITLLFLCLAAFLALAQEYGGPIAALIMAGLSLILASIVLAALKIQSAAEERKRQQRINADKSALMATAAVATVPSILKRPILAAALPLAGIILVSLLTEKKK